uniref:Cadherin domain-containing protein n=1 Tax=Sinocyclocheilus rhinocerous TaxID=307959 RepID=A0A673FR87_9TELE
LFSCFHFYLFPVILMLQCKLILVSRQRPTDDHVSVVCVQGANALVTYSIISGADDSFRIDPESGELTNTRRLDRERRSEYSLLVRADDGSVRVYFNLLDMNDNPPRFSSSVYSGSVLESVSPGATVLSVSATDTDDGKHLGDLTHDSLYEWPNAELHYTIASGDPHSQFSITNTGVLQTRKALDREMQSFYNLVITVNDLALPPMSRFTSTTQVSIILLDVNDCPPSFTSQTTAYIQENTPVDTLVFRAQASDADSGPNSYVEYSLKAPFGNKFSVGNIDGGVVLLGELDREEMANYSLTIVATDKGEPPLSSSMEVTMIVLDVNDNTPSFSQNIYDTEIEENTLSGADVLQVFASDADEGTNGQIRFSIAENSFSINRATGEIRTTRPLDREKVAQYSLRVKATDRGSPPKSTAVKVLISVLDVNDNAPRFSKIFSATVPENAPVGFTVTRVTTTDEDAGANAISRYSISDASLPFIIHPSTGDITISRPLNREDTDHYIAKVSAHDSGWTVSTDVTIFVTDVNDNAPKFSKPSYYLDYPELTEVGSIVTQVSATDPDEGFNGKIFYFIRSQTEHFRINSSSGEIFIKQQLRYQNSSGHNNINVNRHSFIVTASDRGIKPLMSETTVIINVVDSNDNPPTFESSFYFTPVTKSVKVGTTLLKVTAHDHKDFGLNSEIEYAVSGGNSSSKFRLDKQTGSVTVASSLTADTNKVYLLEITASDKGNPPLSAKTTCACTPAEPHTSCFASGDGVFVLHAICLRALHTGSRKGKNST